ncbi:MAG: tetratricopeptide repeat protein [Solirubrobacteraceae bacterium]|nr:tetratricopeptide repeat protein [Solirubrobacteraceae bacterium]
MQLPSTGPVDALLEEAHALFAAGSFAEAGNRLERALPMSTGDPARHREICGDLAVVAAADGRYDEATAIATQVLEAEAGHPGALEVLAHCTQAREQLAGAEALSREIQAARVEQFMRLSTCTRVLGDPVRTQAVQFVGLGRVTLGHNVQFGWPSSPGFYSGYAYVEARNRQTHIEIGENVVFNNSPVLIGEGPGIRIGAETLFGPSIQIMDTDAHDLHPRRRHGGKIETAHVDIGRNVFLGSSVIVTKGVTIGDDTVVGAASVVTKSLPAGVIAGGNPARVIRELDYD